MLNIIYCVFKEIILLFYINIIALVIIVNVVIIAEYIAEICAQLRILLVFT